ncbi:PE family protein [Mycobacterium basiliense]|uniref:PE family protein n=1 Tax=Mycobacterium basiliense TaxID=2094119 RepID=A0A3S4FK45_9MYCO|nr:PE family protein [Mycobacterium basiliense]VDM86994.1 PE family protein [Mycobacterium basiliense]
MAFVVVTPELLAAGATRVEHIGSALGAANAAAVPAITSVVAAAEDEVSAGIASLFSECARAYQALSVQAAGFHSSFVQAIRFASEQYQSAEAEFYALLAARQAQRASLQSPGPDPNHTSPAGGG